MARVNSHFVFRSVSPRKLAGVSSRKSSLKKMLNLPKPEQHPKGLKLPFLQENNIFLQKSKIKPQTQGKDVSGVIQHLSNKKEETLLLKELGR